jgi:hypothetical protein
MGFVPLQGPRVLAGACGLQGASRPPASWLSVLPRIAFVMAIHDGAFRVHPFVGSSARVLAEAGGLCSGSSPGPTNRLFSV